MNDRKVIVALSVIIMLLSSALTVAVGSTVRAMGELKEITAKIEKICENEHKFIPKEESAEKTAKEQAKTILLKNVKLTAYCPCVKCCGKSDGITASGAKAVQGVTAATDRSIPFGAKLHIDGVGERVAQDRGGAIRGNRIDVYFDLHMNAVEFGVKYADVVVEV